MERAGEFVHQQVQLLHSLPSFEALRPNIDTMRMDLGEDEDDAQPMPSEQSIKKAIKKANDMALQKMRSVHGHVGRREAIDQLSGLMRPQGDVVDATNASDWRQLPMEWPNMAAVSSQGEGDGSSTQQQASSGATADSVQQRDEYRQLRLKAQREYEEVQRVREQVAQTEQLLEVVEAVGSDLDTGAVDALKTAVNGADKSIHALQSALADPEKRTKIAARLRANGNGDDVHSGGHNGDGSGDGVLPEKRPKMDPAAVLQQLLQSQQQQQQ